MSVRVNKGNGNGHLVGPDGGFVKPARRNICVNIASGDKMYSWTAIDLANMIGYQIALGDGLQTNYMGSSILSEVRQNLAKSAIEAGAEWMLFVDDDMRFPKNTIDQLISHGQPVVAANCSKRRRPVGPTARRRNGALSGESDVVWPDPNVNGLEQVETVGFGVMLIRADVFRQIEWPWFSQPWIEESQRWVGEDVFFCARCKNAGVPIYIDHGLSWHVRHIGAYEFGMRDVLAERELMESGAWNGAENGA